jgi:hypothetical protein
MKNNTLFSITIALIFISMQTKSQDSIRFQVCPTMWSTGALAKVESVVVSINNPSFPVGELVFYPIGSQNCIEVVIPPDFQATDATYSFTANKAMDGLNGITMNDTWLMDDHILGLSPLPTLTQMLASDANNSGSITTFDVVSIRKNILGEFDNLNWYSLPDYWTFNNPSNPFINCCNELSLSELQTYNGTTMNLSMYKEGDVDGDANPQSNDFSPNYTDLVRFVMSNTTLSAGSETTISFHSLITGQSIGSFQLDLAFNSAALEILNVESSSFSVNYNIVDNRIRILGLANSSNATTDVFQLRVKCLSSGFPVDFIQLVPDALDLANIGTSNNSQMANIELSVSTGTNSLTQNNFFGLKIFPNPSTGSIANMTFSAVQTSITRLIISDVVGKVVFERSVTVEAGENYWRLPLSDFAKGVYLVQMVVDKEVLVGKLFIKQ